jgi:succinate dehydrogenase / fumarate reductase, cytochrome b subunit
VYKKRPKHLYLIKISQPLPAVVSIFHRISGALLFFPGIPLLLCSLQQILDSPQGYARFESMLRSLSVKVGLVMALWFFFHHLCAGIRHLLLDLHYGIGLKQAQTSGRLVLAGGFILTLMAGAAIW